MEDRKLIREEIERLKGELVRGACSAQVAMETACKEQAYNAVLAFIDTMDADAKPTPVERYDVIMYFAQMANGVQLTNERTQKNTDIRMMVAYRMHQEGYSYSEIGKLMSRDHSTVAYWNRCMREMLSLPGAFKNFMGRYEHFNRLLDNEA
jgi:hypothetical protein